MSETRYAGVKARFLALLVDMLLFCIVFFPATRIVKGVWLMSAADHQWHSGWFISDPLCLIFLVIICLYFIILEGLAGATVGKSLVGVRIVDQNGKRPGLTRSLIRNVMRLVDGLPVLGILGIVMIVYSSEKTRVGDLAARTRVVHVR